MRKTKLHLASGRLANHHQRELITLSFFIFTEKRSCTWPVADWPIIIKENRLLHLLKKKEVTPGQSQIDRSSDTAPAWYPSEKWNERKGYLIFCLSPVFQPFTIDFKDQYTIWQLFDRNHLQVVVVWVQVLAVLLDKCLEKKVSLWGCSPRQKGIWYYDDDKENDNNDYD